MRRITYPFGGVFDPGADDYLPGLCFHGALEVGDFAVGHIIAPCLNDAGSAELLEQWRSIGRVLDVCRLVGGGHCGDKPFDIGHGTLLVFNPNLVVDRRVALQVPLVVNRILQQTASGAMAS